MYSVKLDGRDITNQVKSIQLSPEIEYVKTYDIYFLGGNRKITVPSFRVEIINHNKEQSK